jgi:hypothetical protein
LSHATSVQQRHEVLDGRARGLHPGQAAADAK